MRSLTVYTQQYKRELETFFEENAGEAMIVRRRGFTPIDGLFYIRCVYDAFAADAFTRMLESIAIQQHSVYKNSAKLKALALDATHEAVREANTRALARFLRENRVLHMEGYVTFRMYDYLYRLDMMMYAIIKRMRLDGC